MSSGGEFRVGSDAPHRPGSGPDCGAPWSAEWEDRAAARPACRRERGHEGAHLSEETGLDGRCWRYEWGESREPTAERC